MGKITPPVRFFSVAIGISILITSACTKPTDAEKKAITAVVEALGPETPVPEEKDQYASSGTTDKNDDQSKNDEAESSSLSEMDRRFENIDKFLRSLSIDQISLENMNVIPGLEGDNIHGTGLEPEGYTPEADIIYTGQTILSLEEGVTIDDLIDCTIDNPHVNLKVFCSQDRVPETSSQYFFIWFATAETIPTYDPSRSMTLFWGFDSDGNPDNDFLSSDQVPLDFWQGLDRTHVVDYSPQVGWSYSIYADLGSGFVPVQSNAIMILQDNFFGIMGSNQEFNFEEISSNGGVHIHDGTWSLESTAANTAWSGNPVLGPIDFDTNSILYLNVDPELFLLNLSDDSVLCDTGRCSLVYHPEESSGQRSSYTCECNGCTSVENCYCAMYTQSSYTRVGHLEWSRIIVDTIYEPDENSRYKCFCVQDRK